MPEQAPKVPAARSLMHFQDMLMRGMWANRHIESLANNPDTVEAFAQIIECAREYQKMRQEAVQASSSSQLKKADTRNKVCMCLSVCHEETMAWLQCVRGELKKHRGNREAGFAAQRVSCEGYRRDLEKCTQWQSTRMLHAAVLPQDMHVETP